VRCPRCGNENPVANRFCGMCGTTLLQAPATTAAGIGQNQAEVPVARNATEVVAAGTPAPTALKTPPPPAGSPTPVISGPSFLGLNQPASKPSARQPSLSIDPHSGPSSRSLDYLLEDEDEPRGGGAWKFVLIIVALALAVGLGYLRWKHQGLGWLISGTKSPTAATQTSEAPDSSTPAPSSSGTTSKPPAANPTAAVGSQPADSTTTPSSAAPASADPAAATPTAAPTPVTSPTGSPTTPASTPATSPAGDAPKSDSPPAAAAQPTVAKDSSPDASGAPPDATADKPTKDEPVRPAAKPAAPVKPAKADPVAEAQKYLYGRGARQDCERGMRLLKPAAAQSNPKAMIEMGALYSAGLCTPRDLPTAYRWFALALRKDPDNQAVQTDLKKLWGEMTQPERQLAIRLSQ